MSIRGGIHAAASACDVAVLGAGAAGLMCAIEAGKRGKRVVVLERNNQPGKKILISGGGRCNFTNLHCEPDNFLTANPHFPKSALARYTPRGFIDLIEKHRIAYHEKKLGQLFCDSSASQIVDMLLEECRVAGVRIVLDCHVSQVRPSEGFVLETNQGEFTAPALVVASGGLSIPKLGATSLGYDIAKQFGLRVIPCRPALVPLTFSALDRGGYCDLAGVSTDVAASLDGHRFREKMLITHRGLSGPAILQISSYWTPGREIGIDLAPGIDLETEVDLKVRLSDLLPNRFLNRWLERNGFPKALHPLTLKQRTSLASLLHAWRITPAGTEGYEKAEVTAGGVDTGELSSKTMESRRVPGLYFVGELVDVTGHLGGFNFQWAWASGFAAGQAI